MPHSLSLEHILKKSFNFRSILLNSIITIFFISTLFLLTSVYALSLYNLSKEYLVPFTFLSLYFLFINTELLSKFILFSVLYLIAILLDFSFFQTLYLNLAKAFFEKRKVSFKSFLWDSLKKTKYVLSSNFVWMSLYIFVLSSSFFITYQLSFVRDFSNFLASYVVLACLLFFPIYLIPFYFISYAQNIIEGKFLSLKKAYSLLQTNYSLSFFYSVFVYMISFGISALFVLASLSMQFLEKHLSYLLLFSKNQIFIFAAKIIISCLFILKYLLILFAISWIFSFLSLSFILLYYKRHYDMALHSSILRQHKIRKKLKRK